MSDCCCPHGSWQQLKDNYQPKGEDLLYEGVPIYRAGEGHKVLLIVSDIFGAKSSRHRHVADAFAALGYHVFLPEFLITPFEGPISPAVFQNIKGQNFEQMRAKFEKVLKLFQSKGIKQFFGISFCWGVWFNFKLAALYDNFIAIAGLHPSLGIQTIFGGKQIDLVNKLKSPAYLFPASNDPPNIKKDGELILALAEKFGSEKTGTTEFPEMTHGWAVRGDLSEQNVNRDVLKVFQLSQNYFSKF